MLRSTPPRNIFFCRTAGRASTIANVHQCEIESMSDVSGGGKNEAPATYAQPADAAHPIQNFQYYAGATGISPFGMKVQKSQPISRRPANCKRLMASRDQEAELFLMGDTIPS